MKFENLNQEKFEKIEKNELGMLVGGTCDFEETQGGCVNAGSGGTLCWSNDWDNREYDLDGNVISGEWRRIMGEDMATAEALPAKKTR